MTAQVYTHLRIWGGVADGYLDGADAIRVEGDRIAAIGLAAEIGAGAAARDMHGATALPGLIDAHVHIESSMVPRDRSSLRVTTSSSIINGPAISPGKMTFLVLAAKVASTVAPMLISEI